MATMAGMPYYVGSHNLSRLQKETATKASRWLSSWGVSVTLGVEMHQNVVDYL